MPVAEGRLDRSSASLIVGVPRDFRPGGARRIARGDEGVPILNRRIGAATRAADPIHASRDRHPLGHVSLREAGGPWSPECIQASDGARFHPDPAPPDNAAPIAKGTPRGTAAASEI